MSGDEKDIIECQRLLDHTHDFFPFSQIRIIQSSTSPCKSHFRRRKVKRSVWFFLLIFGLAAALPASGQIYQWKDKDGTTHFSDMPPPDQPGIQPKTSKRAQSTVDPGTDEAEATAKGGAGPGNAADAAPAKEKSQIQQRDEEFRKRRATAAEAREKEEKDAARREQREQTCKRARAQHATLNSGQRFSLATEDGGRRVLNDEERAAEIARAEELIKASCDKD
jgi:type IV secretory pathway VirB10-like protein